MSWPFKKGGLEILVGVFCFHFQKGGFCPLASVPSYQHTLRGSLPQRAQGGWEGLGAASQLQRTMSPGRGPSLPAQGCRWQEPCEF